MDKQQAQWIIKETFENSFDELQFVYFIKSLLNSIKEDEEKAFIIPGAYEQYISTLKYIGKYTDGENKIDILIVELKREASLERARTMQRNFISWYLNGGYDEKLKDAALVAFVSPNKEDWRFSLVKMNYKFEEKKDGKVKVKEEFTPARRWSFLVGKNEKSHTAKSRFDSLLMDNENYPTLAELEESFNIEKVTKEFFEKYCGLFLWVKEELDKILSQNQNIKDDFNSKNINTVDFAKKLLGQITFLYFLQKKGWLGVERDATWGTGPKNFLRELFEKKQKYYNYDNFFSDILEPLFYEALRSDRSYDDHYFSMFKCKIPFLNGGLFDPVNDYDWKATDILLPNELFSNSNKTEEDIGNGILDIFDRYNFTVKEDEPLEKEVAIDPEMLGKTYEKFNAIRPDNYEEYKNALQSEKKGAESKFNKQYGVYYTPREIVHYMCQQSLVNYLTTELGDKISKKAIVFLILRGEEYIEHLKTAKEKKEEGKISSRYKEDEYFIELKEYALDIDEYLSNVKICDPAVGSGAFLVGMMTEIVKARLFFTETKCLGDFYENKQGKKLKRNTYNYKRLCIQNSLYGVDIDPGAVEIAKLRLWLSLIVDEENIEDIKPLPNLDYKIVRGNSLLGVEEDVFNYKLFSQLEKLKPLHFDETNTNKKHEYKKQIDDIIFNITNGHKEFDFKVYFSEVFHEKGGFDIVIGNPPYITYKGKQKVDVSKNYVKQLLSLYPNSAEYKINSFALFIEKGLKLVCKKGTLSYIIPSTILQNEYLKKIRKYLLSKYYIQMMVYFENKVFEAITDSIILSVINESNIDRKTEVIKKEEPVFLPNDKKLYYSQSEWNKSNNGIINLRTSTTDDEIISKIEKKSKILDLFLEANIGIKRARAPLVNKPEKNYKRFLKGRDINKYRIIFNNQYILFRKSLFHTGVNEGIFLQSEKILVRKTGNLLLATYDNEQYYTDQSIYNLYPKRDNKLNLKYILALLNSSLMNFYFNKKMITNPDVFPYIKGINLKKLPLKDVEFSSQKPFIDIVDKILSIPKDDDYIDNPTKQTKVKEYEHQIDQLVYELYGLTEDEIEIIEDNT